MIEQAGQKLLIDIVAPGALCGEGAAFDSLPRFSIASPSKSPKYSQYQARNSSNYSADAKPVSFLLEHASSLKQLS
ncbi:hypothetical protein XI00_22960 [Bradyrhizobium sp. CCBAU 21359]|nr:hypothetical protein [Bradyrhizobium sp. CCBAU 21359]